MTSAHISAAAAAKQILGFYDTIPAMNQQAFAAGLVEILSTYPPAVVERASRPTGLASLVAYPNLAKFREHLDKWRDEYWDERRRIERENRPRIAEAPRDPEVDERIAKGLRDLADQLKRGFGPSTA